MGRISKVLRRSYDPVRVKFNSDQSMSKRTNTKNKKKKNKKKLKQAVSSTTRRIDENIETTNRTLSLLESVQTLHEAERNINKTSSYLDTSARGHDQGTNSTSTHGRKTPPKQKKPANNNKKGQKSDPKVRAVLYGLSTMKRDGDVTVNIMADYTTVKSKFLVGPLTLKVQKEYGRGVQKEMKTATATTVPMHGKLSLRIIPGGAATLHSIKVMQPKQVRIDSPDDHDKTREYMWQRSHHIAKMVSKKLTNATKSMLQPMPNNRAK